MEEQKAAPTAADKESAKEKKEPRDVVGEVTALRVQQWYALLVRCGVAQQIDVALNGQRKGPRKVTAAEQAESADLDMSLEVEVNMPALIAGLGARGVVDMCAIIFDVPEEEAEKVTMEDLALYAPFFIAQSLQPIGVLASFEMGS